MFSSQAGGRPRTWEARPSEHKKWVEVFRACDEDNKGYLSREDFKVAVVMLFGYKPSKIEADSVMSSVDPNTSGIQLKEFLDIVRKKKEAQLYRNEVRHIFTAFDRHYRGYLTLEDFKKAFKQVAPKLSERIILEVFSWELISGRLPSGDVFIVKNVKRAEPSATQSPKENPEGRVPAAPCGPRSSPPSAHQCLPFVGHHSQDDFTNHELSLSEQWEAGRVEKRCLCAR